MNNPNLLPKGSQIPSPVKIFSNYYLNNEDGNVDNGFSKKKNNLLKDYLNKETLDRDEFVK